ncbi:putative N-acetylmuramoyl-L-alanine amidase [Bacillus sp. TS-2]|nr:putative N-acetylmuramoyl-L-alanine amidase [Bacillus sp. TS-2]
MEFIGMSGTGKSTLINSFSHEKPKLKSQKFSLHVCFLLLYLPYVIVRLNFTVRPISFKARVKINERFTIGYLKHLKYLISEEEISIIDEGIIHTLFFSLDNRVKKKEVKYHKLIHLIAPLINRKKLLVVFVDAEPESIRQNRMQRNRLLNEKAFNISSIMEERNRNNLKRQVLFEHAVSFRTIFYDKSEDYSLLQEIFKK